MTENYTDEITAVLRDCAAALYCPREKFYPKKVFGSYIRAAGEISQPYLLAYARQALADFDGVYVIRAVKDGGTLSFGIAVNDEERTVSIPIEADI